MAGSRLSFGPYITLMGARQRFVQLLLCVVGGGYKVSNTTLGPKFKCQSVSTIKPFFLTPTVESRPIDLSTHQDLSF